MKKKTGTTLVWNLATNEEHYFCLEPLEALVSAAIMEAKETGNLTNPVTRQRYHKKIITGKHSASIGDLAVKI